jgi:hypothetical protein
MIERLYEFAFAFRHALWILIVILAVLGIFTKANAFWPPDMVPHVGYPEIEELDDVEDETKMV